MSELIESAGQGVSAKRELVPRVETRIAELIDQPRPD